MMVFSELAQRGLVKQSAGLDSVAAQARSGRIMVYAGFDPTADSLHVGHLVPLLCLSRFVDHGHLACAVIGGGTAMVGDPTGKAGARRVLSSLDIEANLNPIRTQLFSIASASIVFNNESWLSRLALVDFIRDVGAHFSVNRMISAEPYASRMESGVSFLELSYQLLQAYDFFYLHQSHGCSLQIGGDDQWSNMLAGADLIRRRSGSEVGVMTLPLLTTSSGVKMGKTATGAVWLSAQKTSVFDFYQFFLNVDDRDVGRFLRMLTFVPLGEIERLESLCGSEVMEAKARLAMEVTTIVHGAKRASNAADASRVFAGYGEAGEHVPAFVVDVGTRVADAIASAGLASSRTEARRLIEQGAVRVGNRKVSSVDDVISREDVSGVAIVRVGKKRVRRFVESEK